MVWWKLFAEKNGERATDASVDGAHRNAGAARDLDGLDPFKPTQKDCRAVGLLGSSSGENYWYQHTQVWEKERLLRFTPRSVVDPRSRRRTMIPEEEYLIPIGKAKVVREGNDVTIVSFNKMMKVALGAADERVA